MFICQECGCRPMQDALNHIRILVRAVTTAGPPSICPAAIPLGCRWDVWHTPGSGCFKKQARLSHRSGLVGGFRERPKPSAAQSAAHGFGLQTASISEWHGCIQPFGPRDPRLSSAEFISGPHSLIVRYRRIHKGVEIADSVLDRR